MLTAPSLAAAGYNDFFASLQTVQTTVQTQVERFQELMLEIKRVSAAHQDDESLRRAGEIALKLHRVHTLLFGGALMAQPQEGTTTSAGSAAAEGDAIDLDGAMAEFSSLLSRTRLASTEAELLLAQASEELAALRAQA
ncbi:hypothetical protein CS062_22725 [Roseateles chitinivorans]|jgi:hypothetical protein|uniref:Uncharacterized protein n=1 Tax=Roseateles chitinivorans TaxID=2917965 RepID=A0A2G9C383_9BURK|nr:hypothetical protein [Roseateles chitinivorans]PIM50873.1 hypothetical protein CS062_22725 [Roseateles chitinivorans]